MFAKTDVTKEEDWKKALEIAKSKFGTLDILVNNAGWTYKKKDSLTVTEVEYDRESVSFQAIAILHAKAIWQVSLTST